jgi:hypothetical protein
VEVFAAAQPGAAHAAAIEDMSEAALDVAFFLGRYFQFAAPSAELRSCILEQTSLGFFFEAAARGRRRERTAQARPA